MDYETFMAAVTKLNQKNSDNQYYEAKTSAGCTTVIMNCLRKKSNYSSQTVAQAILMKK
jgi:hypothetical protein